MSLAPISYFIWNVMYLFISLFVYFCLPSLGSKLPKAKDLVYSDYCYYISLESRIVDAQKCLLRNKSRSVERTRLK